MTQDRTKTLRQVITIGSATVLLSIVLGLGNYFALKTSLEKDVTEKIKIMRNDLQKTFPTVNYSSSPAKLQDADGYVVEFETEKTTTAEKGREQLTDPHIKGVMSLVSALNRTLSNEIQQLNNASKALNEKMDTTQKKTKILEEIVNHNGDEPKGQVNKMKVNPKIVNDPAKENKMRKMTPPTEKHVYFSVALTKTLNNLTEDHLIPFDMVYNNDGDGYDTKTGKFKVPVAGTYLFMLFVQVVNEEGKRAHVNLVIDGQNKASAVAEAWHKGQEMTSANAAVTHLKNDQKVWVQTAHTNGTLYDIDRERTTFTGVLLYS